MKSKGKKVEVQVHYRRYSDHPVVQAKVAKAKEFLAKADLSFLDNPPTKE